MKTGKVTGEYVVKATGKRFIVTGLADAIGGTLREGVVGQGIALTMSDGKNVLSMAGGVDLSDPK